MGRSLVELESIVRNKICSVCTDRTVDGQCGLEEPSHCALFRLFPQVAQAIQSVTSDDIQQYLDAIRHDVCSVCVDQASDGSCETRQQVRCHRRSYREDIRQTRFRLRGHGFTQPVRAADPVLGIAWRL